MSSGWQSTKMKRAQCLMALQSCFTNSRLSTPGRLTALNLKNPYISFKTSVSFLLINVSQTKFTYHVTKRSQFSEVDIIICTFPEEETQTHKERSEIIWLGLVEGWGGSQRWSDSKIFNNKHYAMIIPNITITYPIGIIDQERLKGKGKNKS